MRIIKVKGKELIVEGSEVPKLKESFIGEFKEGKIFLKPEEALYLMDMRKWICMEGNKVIDFNELASKFLKEQPKLFARYNTYRDWKDRGLFIKFFKKVRFGKLEKVKYPSTQMKFPKIDAEAGYFPFDMISVIEKGRKYFKLFADFWFGQLGVYKKHERGKTLKLDIFETLFLLKHCGLKVTNLETREDLDFNSLLALTKNFELFKALYEVYEDWRLRGFIVKTGYKFGSHFRIYFPGVSPVRKDRWIHSKHVLHVFPKYERMLISEWARAIRVAHSVRKTFILGIPGMKEEDYKEIELDFITFHRKNGKVVTPKTGKPSFCVLAVSEDEFIGGAELASALRIAEEVGLNLLLAVTERESGVTYYLTRQIELPGSRYQYYEIEWFQP